MQQLQIRKRFLHKIIINLMQLIMVLIRIIFIKYTG